MSAQAGHTPAHYIRIWAILLVLLIISILGPMLEIRVVTLVTAFGIAIVKALMVAAYFMHLNVEKRYIWYMLVSMLIFDGVFFFAISPDIRKPEGRNWINSAAKTLIEQHAAPAPAQH